MRTTEEVAALLLEIFPRSTVVVRVECPSGCLLCGKPGKHPCTQLCDLLYRDFQRAMERNQ